MSEVDWLSHLLQIVTVTGQLEVRCAYGAPWRLVWRQAAANELPYHVIVKGRAIFEDPKTRTAQRLWPRQSGINLFRHSAVCLPKGWG